MAEPKKLSIWTDSTDYVVAESAEAARTTVIHCGGVDEESVGPLNDWHALPDDQPFAWQDEECGPKTMIPAAEAVRRLTENGMQAVANDCKIEGCTCRTSHYFASTEW